MQREINYHYPLYETTVFENFKVMVENVADKYPDRPAFAYKLNPADQEPVQISYSQARVRIRALGTGFIAQGLTDSHVALIGDTSFDWISSYFALIAVGAVVVPLDKDLPVDELRKLLLESACQQVVCSQSVYIKLAPLQLPLITQYYILNEAAEKSAASLEHVATAGQELLDKGDTSYADYRINPDRMATIVYTSGTTGSSKGVMLSQTNICCNMTNGMYLFAITPKTISVLPPHHTFGSTVSFVGHFAQGSLLYLSSGLRYIASEIKQQQPTHLVLVPIFLEKLHKKIWSAAAEKGQARTLRLLIRFSNGLRKLGLDIRRKLFASVLAQLGGRLEMVISGGAALAQEIIDTFEGIGITVLNGYGITECAPLVSCNRNKYQKKASVGVPILQEEIKIADPDINGEGEICVKGPNVMLGYYNDPAATSAVFDEEGFFHTGDLGRLDEEGWLYLTGRIKNLIVLSNGKNVSPEEIEAAIAGISGVQEVIVYAGESQVNKDKEVIVAEIYPDAEMLTSAGINDFQAYFNKEIQQLNQQMPSYKYVNLVKVRQDEFMKNTSRKIQRFNIDKRID